ncbi:Probable transmembrane protein of unknown function [Flavobacterium indicum GPTSA100-9 = DSM 17447]|uniref:Transglutaminase-like domain-containing protein n=2 Tax=Flavobacterium TaxID=237 RepID=H8XQM4_FLAIG|nr:Probable transmembrane protein of unknown function [Flavobacterium indicum GPTSA100-9 = DSM 17447]
MKLNQWQTTIYENKWWSTAIVIVLSFLISIPVFVFFRKNIFDLNWEIPIDKIVLFLLIFSVFFYLVYKFRKKLILSFLIYLSTFIIASLEGNYSFFKVVDAYRIIVYNADDNYENEAVKPNTLLPFPNKKRVEESVDYLNPKVRNFALYCVNKHFKKEAKLQPENRKYIQYFAVFTEINSRWNYVNDPKTDEYFANASESLTYFSGDCDDHAILMAATIKSIGGTMRLIHTGRHMYPELLIGKAKDLEQVVYIIKNELFKNLTKGKVLFIHRDEDDKIWLNMDYTAHYPGGPFLGEEILGILRL